MLGEDGRISADGGALLEQLINAAARAAYKRSTNATYDSAWRTFLSFCYILGARPETISEWQLCAAMWLYVHSRMVTGVDSFLSAVNRRLKDHCMPELPRGDFFKQHRRGLLDLFGPVDVRAPSPPVDESDLLTLHRSLDHSVHAHARFFVNAVVGFQALLRVGEFAGGRLRMHDILRTPEGLRIRVPFSKANNSPVWIAVVSRDDALCPVRALDNFIATGGGDRLYPGSTNAFNSELKRRLRHVNVHKIGLSSHALRRGGATALFAAGAAPLTIMAHGRWSSDSWRQYIELGYAQQLLATQLLRAAAPAA